MIELHAVCTDTVRRVDAEELRRRMPERVRKAARYRQENDRLLCLGGGLLMIRALGIRDESVLSCGPYGKPFLPGKEKFFNLSHSGEWCLMAVSSRGPVGVDIEQVNEANLQVSSVVFTEAERQWMKDEPAERFHMLWTWKESVMKALGLGMELEPAGFEVLPFSRGEGIRIHQKRLYAFSGRLEDYPFSVCSEEPVNELCGWEWRQTGGVFHPEPLNYIRT